MFPRLSKTDSTKPLLNTDPTTESQPNPSPKKSLYRRFQDSKRGEISDADVLKYTGMSKDALNGWAADRPGVGGNRAAGSITAGSPSGLGGMMAETGYGGWGTDANGTPKFPPAIKSENRESDDEAAGVVATK
ncbi:hypothetical protein HER10_EVM0002258 [Colletotrichum scovillei]|uniref:Uncharacterized protein n=1 Tax=Colletotrichum scovillei TaxID=1209932 RepID=A0A9P7R383_9PEZI|nr:uncharacterized protein HER10_EVM0002258 [Colletotrichum scovillei]KAF4773598.1 hypothetical protein HER10_EVM0002258 [Colletotrichum scovillei]KAG7048696.1 hypothetical protein JMJ77_0014330 [Colletotrichum scovillei]KAG7065860.1 hypothetical protein JMJ78_0012604 [Colletotrichum scovillei]KAG7068463.1 hypothetical protein JMJ76_0008150 [Colletotrichum scovillei]